ncbi:MAG: rod shape-determining protein MreC [Pseudomonadales bacterium]|nr:rod shape-determining protein MreC [Pseudomonadales bacterium]
MEAAIKALFLRQSGAGYLLLALVILSLALMAVEQTTRLLAPVRATLLTGLMPVTVIGESPYLLGRTASEAMATREQLQARNQELEAQFLSLSHLAQQYHVLRAENERLLALVESRARLPAEVMAAEIIGIVPRENTLQVIIDRGTQAGVTEGDPVIDARGLFGQVVEAGVYSSRVLLVTDKDHAVPVEVNRNGVRSIAGGTGRIDRMELEFVPVTTDIVVGDELVTSGLGGRFPRGYPVGTVTEVVVETNSSFARVTVAPAAELDRSRHVLVVFARDGQAAADGAQSGDAGSAPESGVADVPGERAATPEGGQ